MLLVVSNLFKIALAMKTEKKEIVALARNHGFHLGVLA
jgi:hypothetical protein